MLSRLTKKFYFFREVQSPTPLIVVLSLFTWWWALIVFGQPNNPQPYPWWETLITQQSGRFWQTSSVLAAVSLVLANLYRERWFRRLTLFILFWYWIYIAYVLTFKDMRVTVTQGQTYILTLLSAWAYALAVIEDRTGIRKGSWSEYFKQSRF